MRIMRLQNFNVNNIITYVLCYCKPTKGILPEEAAMPTEESSMISERDDQDSTWSSESNQPDQPRLPPRMY